MQIAMTEEMQKYSETIKRRANDQPNQEIKKTMFLKALDRHRRH